jgi:MiaB-like tRNA modifying enzyme
MVKIFIETYGCSYNQADTEIMAGILKCKGYDIVDSFQKSDVNIINTCIVKTPTEQRMIYRVQELSKLNKPLVVAGCMAKTSRRTIEKISPHACLLGPDSIQKITEVVEIAVKNKKGIFLEDLKQPKVCLPRVRKNPVINIVPIAEGCLSNCAYCSVKFARGRLHSYSPELIVKEVENAVNEGCKEIWITSQDNACYGKDINTTLPELLKKISEIDGNFFVRVGMMNPAHTTDILEDLLDAYESKKIFKFLHLPVQSGSDSILELMKRNYTVKDFLHIVKNFRIKFPELNLSTDIIIGFPGETENDFKKTEELIKNIKPDTVNLSKYGARPNTEASTMEKVNKKIIDERSVLMHELIKKIALERNKNFIGWKGKVLIDEFIKDSFVGRNINYKPVVVKTKKKIFGEMREIKISDVKSNYLIAG